MKKIKVIHLRSSFNPGGTETLLLNIFNEKQDLFKIFLILLDGGTYVKRLNNKNNQYYEYYRGSKIDFKVLFLINKIIRKENIRIIHTHQLLELIYAFLLKLINPKLKIFHSIHLFPKNYYTLHSIIEIFLSYFCQKIIAVSYSLRKYLAEHNYPKKKLITLYNPVNIPNNNKNRIDWFVNRIKMRNDDFKLIMIGNFRPEKDQMTLINSFLMLVDKYPKLKLIFIGKISEEFYLVKNKIPLNLMNDRIFFLGQQEDASIFVQYCDLFIYSTFQETFGIACIEALLQKVPVLASDIDTMIELSNYGKYFWLFKKGDCYDLANKIEWFIKNINSHEVKSKIELAYNYAKQEFDISGYIKKLYNIYTIK